MEVGTKLFEIQGSGIVTPASKSAPVPTAPELTPSKKPEFDANIIANGLDDEKEGGVFVARSTGATGMSNEPGVPAGLGFILPEQKGFELSGFTAKYNIPNSKDIAATEVRVYFKNLESAKAVIQGNRYVHTSPRGEVISCEIIRGGPVIALDEVEKLKYLEGKWNRP